MSTKTIWPSASVPDPEEPAPRRLRLVGDDGDLRARRGRSRASTSPRSAVRRRRPCRSAGSRSRPRLRRASRRPSRRTRTRWIRRRSASSTMNEEPRLVRGLARLRDAAEPLGDEAGDRVVLGRRETSRRRASRSPGPARAPPPSTSRRACATTGGSSSSCSSAISPTSSSTRSSSVARPVTAPYSSTTIASGWRRRRKSERSVATVCVSGAKKTSRASGRAVAGGSGRAEHREDVLDVDDADRACRSRPSTSGIRVNFVFTKRSATSSSGASASANTMSGRGVITSPTVRSPKSTARETSSSSCFSRIPSSRATSRSARTSASFVASSFSGAGAARASASSSSVVDEAREERRRAAPRGSRRPG